MTISVWDIRLLTTFWLDLMTVGTPLTVTLTSVTGWGNLMVLVVVRFIGHRHFELFHMEHNTFLQLFLDGMGGDDDWRVKLWGLTRKTLGLDKAWVFIKEPTNLCRYYYHSTAPLLLERKLINGGLLWYWYPSNGGGTYLDTEGRLVRNAAPLIGVTSCSVLNPLRISQSRNFLLKFSILIQVPVCPTVSVT